MKSSLLLCATLVCAGFQLPGQSAATRPVQPQIQLVQPLSFGGLVVDPSGGGITLTADGALIPLGPGVQAGATPPCAEARFRLSGPPRAAFTVKVDPPVPSLMGPSAGSVRIAEFQGSLASFRGNFDALGQAELKLGARLDLAANTAPGTYSAAQMKLQLFVANGSNTDCATVPFQISALVRAGLRLANASPLDFGMLLAGDLPGLFQVLPDGGHRSHPGGPILVKGTPRPASFAIQGYPGTSYTIQLPTQARLSGPGTSMGVQDFSCTVPLSGSLPPGGLTFGVGASLMVAPAQTPGRYRGTFQVTVNYP